MSSRNVYTLYDQTRNEQIHSFDIADLVRTKSQFWVMPVQQRITIAEQYRKSYQSIQKIVRPPQIEQDASQENQQFIKLDEFIKKQGLYLGQLKNCQTQKKLKLHDLKTHEVLERVNPPRMKITDPSQQKKLSQIEQEPKKWYLRTQTNYSLVQNPSFNPKSELNTFAKAEDLKKSQVSSILASFEKTLLDKQKFSKEDLKQFFIVKYDIKISNLTAYEGIHYSRGKLMEKSSFFDREQLVDWLYYQIPILQKNSTIQEQQNGTNKHKNMKIEENFEVENVLKVANLSNKAKSKLRESLILYEEQLSQERAQQGILGQFAAQQRLAQTAREIANERTKEIKRQIDETCNYDSAVRALSLQKNMNELWSEGKNSYKVVSKLSEKQKRRYVQLMDKRMKYPLY